MDTSTRTIFHKELFSRIQPSTLARQLSGHVGQAAVRPKGPAIRNDIVDDIVDVSSSTMAFNVAKIVSARASLTISLTISLRVAGPLVIHAKMARWRATFEFIILHV